MRELASKGSSHRIEQVFWRARQELSITAYGGWIQVQPLDGHVCYGDSGGPVLLGNIALGIHKANANSGSCTGVAFDMRLDTVRHRAFLAQYVTLP